MSLCHWRYSYYCRIAKYWLKEDRWEIVPAAVGVSAVFPDYSPDGRTIAYAEAHCPQYRCDFNDFKLITMRPDGSERRALPSHGAQMPAFSPDSKRIVYWALGGTLRSESARTYVWWDLYERAADGSGDERRVTDQGYPGIYTGPRYLPDGESILFTAWNDRVSGYTFVVDRFDGMRRSPVQRLPIPPWRTVDAQYLHAFHATRGWLLGRSAVSFLPPGPGASPVAVYDATPYEASVVDVSPSGRWVVSLQGATKGTMARGGFAGYWNAATPVINRPAVPVMAVVDVESLIATPIANWPADVEPVNSRPDD